jgi:hypothetical protein
MKEIAIFLLHHLKVSHWNANITEPFVAEMSLFIYNVYL